MGDWFDSTKPHYDTHGHPVIAGRTYRGDEEGVYAAIVEAANRIPENAMRVGPGTDAVVWRICPSHEAEL